jgi:hypothetical protein
LPVRQNAPSPLPQKLRPQHQPLHLLMPAIHFVGVAGEFDAFDHGAAFQRDISNFATTQQVIS